MSEQGTPSELNVDQTTQLVADQFEIAFNGSDVFWADDSDFATIDTGLLDDNLDPIMVRAITSAIIDEVELHVKPDRQDTVMRGRNQASYAVETTAFVTYSVTGAPSGFEQTQTIPGFPALPIIPGVTVPLIKQGAWTARRIVEDLASRAGLGCVYNAPDYRMRENFVVNGPIIGAIQELIAPFNFFDPSKIDIWEEDSTLFVQQRTRTGAGTELDVHDSRMTQLMVRRTFLGFIGVLRLIGSRTGVSGFGVAVTGFSDTSDTDETEDANGNITTRIVTAEHKRDIDGAVITQDIDVSKDSGSGLTLVSFKHTVSEWEEPIVVYPNQLVNNPKENKRTIIELNEETQEQTRTTITHVYDPAGFLRTQSTDKETFDTSTSAWTPAGSEVKTYRDNGTNAYQVTTQQFGSDGSPGDTRRTTCRGQRPGGNAISQTQNVNDNTVQVTYGTIISQERGAKDITIQNNNLLLADLKILAAEATFASGATEVEITFTAAGMPWLKRGTFITITGLEDELGYPHDLGPAMVTECRVEFREDAENPTYLTFVKASYWVK